MKEIQDYIRNLIDEPAGNSDIGRPSQVYGSIADVYQRLANDLEEGDAEIGVLKAFGESAKEKVAESSK